MTLLEMHFLKNKYINGGNMQILGKVLKTCFVLLIEERGGADSRSTCKKTMTIQPFVAITFYT